MGDHVMPSGHRAPVSTSTDVGQGQPHPFSYWHSQLPVLVEARSVTNLRRIFLFPNGYGSTGEEAEALFIRKRVNGKGRVISTLSWYELGRGSEEG